MIRLRAAAKVNLALRVGGRGGDGFHPIATVFQTISLCDRLFARRAPSDDIDDGEVAALAPVRLEVVGAELPADNTVTAAVAAMAEAAREIGADPAPLAMRLVKRIPAGAGLGGGSSDAVAAMAACARLWGLDTGDLHGSGGLQRVAESVGSDVPFFLHGGTAMGSGRGTRVEPLEPLPPTWLVLAAPPQHVSTADAYAAFDQGAAAPAVPPIPSYRPELSQDWMVNDLEPVVGGLHPEVTAVVDRLAELGGLHARMTGSGAASFAAFAGRRQAARAAAALRAAGSWAGAYVSITAAQHRRGLFA